MQDEVKTENADSVKNTASTVEEVVEETIEETPVVESTAKNMSEEDFINLRMGGESQPKTKADVTSDTEETQKDEAKAVVPSQVDLENMSEAELKELSEKLGSRAVARFGELTAKRKAAEEKATRLEAELQKNSAKKQVSMAGRKDNPYKDINNMKDIQSKMKEVSEIIEWSEDILFDSDSQRPSDIVANIDGKEITKTQVRDMLKNARKSQKRHLPQQAQYLKSIESGKQLQKGFEERIRNEIPWASDPENEVNKRYNAMLNDSRLKATLANAMPEVKAQMPYIIAHAANSLYGNRTLVQETKPVVPSKTINPPKAVKNTAAKTEKRSSRREKSIQTNQTSFRSTGGIDDFIKLRTAQMSR